MLHKLPRVGIMSSSVLHPKLKFLLDENVKTELYKFLESEGLDVVLAPRGFSNGKLAAMSKSEERILVTNDSHFTDSELFPEEKIFSIIWLRISQDKPESLLKEFSKLLKVKSSPKDFEGFLITLEENDMEFSAITSTLTK